MKADIYKRERRCAIVGLSRPVRIILIIILLLSGLIRVAPACCVTYAYLSASGYGKVINICVGQGVTLYFYAGAEVEADPEENPLHWVLNWGYGGSSTSHMYDSTHGPSDAGYYDTCYNWSDFSMVNAATTFNHTYPASIPAGVYTPSLTVEREYGENCGVRSDTCTLNVIKVNSVSQDKTTACMNQDVTFTANSYPSNKPLSCIQWQRRYATTSAGVSSATYESASGGDNTAVLNTSTAGFYQYRARNGSGDSWKASSVVEIVGACECTEADEGEDGWLDYVPTISDCSPDCTGCDPTPCVCSNPLTDDCGNSIEVQCGPEPYCRFRNLYKTSTPSTTTMSDCIWHGGSNAAQYKLSFDGSRLHSFRHITLHPHNNNCSSGCANVSPGYYCWKLTIHNCINDQNICYDWLRSTEVPSENDRWSIGESHECPGP